MYNTMHNPGMAQNRSHREQFKPLAPFITSSPSPTPSPFNNHQAVSEQQIIRLRKCIKFCGCITALLCIMAVIVIVLGFTVYNVKEPEVTMNRAIFQNGNITINGISSSSNITLLADISVKNTNQFTFRFGTTTTTVYYDGTGIGEGTSPAGKAKARRTIRFNVTMNVAAEKLNENPNFMSDLLSDQALNISSYTKINGNVKIFNIFKRSVEVELNCTVEYNVTTGKITNGDNCLRRVSD